MHHLRRQQRVACEACGVCAPGLQAAAARCASLHARSASPSARSLAASVARSHARTHARGHYSLPVTLFNPLQKRGNVIKVDRHKYVKVAYHGFRQLTSERAGEAMHASLFCGGLVLLLLLRCRGVGSARMPASACAAPATARRCTSTARHPPRLAGVRMRALAPALTRLPHWHASHAPPPPMPCAAACAFRRRAAQRGVQPRGGAR